MEGFDADTISSSIDFCYGNKSAIVRKEFKVFEFAEKYDIYVLKEACCHAFEENVCKENVFEIVQIAYSHNFEELKEKCKKVLAENKGKLDLAKLNGLSKNVLIDVFCI
uniref:BTB domain-containing protein n=1 Tax=Panagrolaimus davidi TaxID=227884 RepID=A0A914P626_9BILA